MSSIQSVEIAKYIVFSDLVQIRSSASWRDLIRFGPDWSNLDQIAKRVNYDCRTALQTARRLLLLLQASSMPLSYCATI